MLQDEIQFKRSFVHCRSKTLDDESCVQNYFFLQLKRANKVVLLLIPFCKWVVMKLYKGCKRFGIINILWKEMVTSPQNLVKLESSCHSSDIESMLILKFNDNFLFLPLFCITTIVDFWKNLFLKMSYPIFLSARQHSILGNIKISLDFFPYMYQP